MYYSAPPKFLTNKSETNWCHFWKDPKSSGTLVLYVSVQRIIQQEKSGRFIRIGGIYLNRRFLRLTSAQTRNVVSQEFNGLQFYNRRKCGGGEKILFVFFEQMSCFIISSSCKLSKRVFLSLRGQTRSTNYYFFICVQSIS